MKKNLLIASLLVTGLLASCSKETGQVPPQGQQELKFSVATTDVPTRATPVVGTTFPNGQFKIHGYNKVGASYTTKVLDGAIATVAGAAVTLDGTYYKPLVSAGSAIYCIYPSTVSALATDVPDATPTLAITHTVPTTFATQPDVLYARDVNGTTFPQNIDLVFDHMLTRVTFQCRVINNPSNAVVKISSITLNDAVSTGTLTVGLTGDPTWSNNTATDNYTATVGTSKVIGSTYDLKPDTEGDGTEGDNEKNYTNVFASTDKNNSLLMIPASITQLNAMNMVVTVNINGTDVTLNPVTGIGTTTQAEIGSGWLKGKNVNYRMELDVNKVMPSIKITTVRVNDWGDPEHVDIPLNP